MTLKNVKIVLPNTTIYGYISFHNGFISEIKEGECHFSDALDYSGKIVMPGFIDIHIHGCSGVDFMDAKEEDYSLIEQTLFKEGVTSFLATTLTSDKASLLRVCKTVKNVKNKITSLVGIHFEGPYICTKYKGAQNPDYIRNPNIQEFVELQKESGGNIRYISLAPEKEGAMEFIKHVTSNHQVVVSAGHTNATFGQIEESIKQGLTNTTHTHNAMSGHHHRDAGVVTAAFYFDSLYTEFICDGFHVTPEALKTSYKIIGPDRFVVITDALKIKHTDTKEFELFGLPCIRKDGVAYLKSGPFAGSLLTMDKALKNMKEYCDCSLSELSKITSLNAAKSLHLDDRGKLEVGKIADFVILDKDLNLIETYKLGKKVF